MPSNPSKLTQFWQELKRRNVTRVLAVYIAAGFMILELVDMISEPFGLPDWSLKVALLILIAGLILTVVLSWIYDIHSEGGIVKTKPSHKVKEENKPGTSYSWKLASYISFVVIVGLIILNIIPRATRSEEVAEMDKSIAVLPFENMSDSSEFAHLGDAMTDEIIMQLYKIKAFEVRSRTSIMQYKNTKKGSPVIGEELHANYLLEGSTQRYKDKVRIRVQLIHASTDDHIWADIYEGEWKDIFDIQINVAKHVARELKTVLSPEEVEHINKKPTDNFEAYDLFLRGRFYSYRKNEYEYRKAIEYFQKAINLEPEYALAYASMAHCYKEISKFSYIDSKEGYSLAKKAISRALEIDETLGEAHATLGSIMLHSDWNMSGPEGEFQRAIELSPGSADVYAMYSNYLTLTGKLDESIDIAKQAIRLDPLAPDTRLGSTYFYAGYYDESISHFKSILKRDPDYIWGHLFLSYNYTLKGMNESAIAHIDTTVTIWPSSSDPILIANVGWVYARAGHYEKAHDSLKQLLELSKSRNIDPFTIALIYTGLGDKENAFDWLFKAYENHSGLLILLKAQSNSIYRDISSDPRYTDLLVKIGFEVN